MHRLSPFTSLRRFIASLGTNGATVTSLPINKKINRVTRASPLSRESSFFRVTGDKCRDERSVPQRCALRTWVQHSCEFTQPRKHDCAELCAGRENLFRFRERLGPRGSFVPPLVLCKRQNFLVSLNYYCLPHLSSIRHTYTSRFTFFIFREIIFLRRYVT